MNQEEKEIIKGITDGDEWVVCTLIKGRKKQRIMKNTYTTLVTVGWIGIGSTQLFDGFFNTKPFLGGLCIILSILCLTAALILALIQTFWEKRYTYQLTFPVFNETLDDLLDGIKEMRVTIAPRLTRDEDLSDDEEPEED